ncbi:hypothetical protein [Paenibacillus sp. FSL R10-2771]|uniref:hypothetical protein n=1 Tax=Paenibacillus sp. FSL R10-2771 TaxID=2954693 RepID=UPI0030FB286F
MRVTIVNCFDTYEYRVDMLHDFFENEGHEVSVVQSDFRHFKKIKRTEEKKGYTFVETKSYNTNMSAARLISHYYFAKKAFEYVEVLKPDLLYVIIPPNSLTKYAAKYKKKHRNVKLIFDLMDLWPETLPIRKIKWFPPITSWRRIRDKNLKFADFVITECNLYQSVLKKVLKNLRFTTVYLAKRELDIIKNLKLDTDDFHLCYLGSINNIIDVPKIKEIIKVLQNEKNTTIHIIGDGESRDLLIREIKSTGANVEYYGQIFDHQKKQDIFNKCHFGLNIMKDNVCIGLTMKSIDYLQAGLPILNNIPADTFEIVDKFQVGFNISTDNLQSVVQKVTSLDLKEILTMRMEAEQVYKNLFSSDAFYGGIKKIIDSIFVR